MPPTVAPPAPPKPESTPPVPVEAPVSFDADIDKELASLDDSAPPSKPASPPKPAAQPAEKPKAATQPEQPQKPEEPVRPVKAADLRGAYETLKKKVKDEYEPELSKLRNRVQELESRKPEDNSQLVKDFEDAKKRRDELESEMRFQNYRKSSEFQQKYAKPYEDAWKKAIAELSELTVTDDQGNTRAATTADLVQLANMPLGEARRQARVMFGEAADDVMAHRRTIRELSEAQEKALEDAKSMSAEREKKLTSERQIQHQQTLQLWKKANEDLAKKYPNWFSTVEGDAEGNTLLNKGFALADLRFVGAKDLSAEQIEMLPERFKNAIKANDGMLPVQDRVALDALLRNKIASHSRLALNLKRAKDRIKELETSLAQYESSEPPAGKGGSGGGGRQLTPLEDAEAELDAIDRKNG